MKKQILYSLLVFFSLGMQAQNLSVDLSVEWRREKTYFQDSLLSEQTPYLKITYTNLGTDSIYALKPIRNYGNIARTPLFPIALPGLSTDWKFEKRILEEAKIKLNVLIGGEIWLTFLGPFTNESVTFGWENTAFYSFYKTLLGKKYGVSYRPSIDPFSPITEEFVLNELENNVVFLAPSEKKEEYYNLIGFKAIGGEYTYFFIQKEILGCLRSKLYFDKLNKAKTNEMKLPPKVGNYKLYTGPFHTNKLVLSFSGCLRENK